MMLHDWQNDPTGTTKTDVLWRCARCSAVVGFNLKGVGEPSASETELPDNADDYVGPCEVPPVQQDDIQLLSKAVLGGLDVNSLVQAGKLTEDEKLQLEGNAASDVRGQA